LRVVSTTPFIASPDVQDKQFASAAVNIRSQVGSQALDLVHVLRLSPGIKKGSYACGRRVGGGIQSTGRVSNGVNVVQCRSDAADAASRYTCPGGRNTSADATGASAARLTRPGGTSAASWCPTALSVATTWPAASIATYATVRLTITPRRASPEPQNVATSALHTHVMQIAKWPRTS